MQSASYQLSFNVDVVKHQYVQFIMDIYHALIVS